MSQERLEVLRRLYADYNAGRLEAMAGLLDPEMVVELCVAPEPEIYQGVEGFRKLDHIVHEAFGNFRAEPEEFIDAGGVVLVPISFRVRGAQSGVDLTQKAFQSGRCAEVRSHGYNSFSTEHRPSTPQGYASRPRSPGSGGGAGRLS